MVKSIPVARLLQPEQSSLFLCLYQQWRRLKCCWNPDIRGPVLSDQSLRGTTGEIVSELSWNVSWINFQNVCLNRIHSICYCIREDNTDALVITQSDRIQLKGSYKGQLVKSGDIRIEWRNWIFISNWNTTIICIFGWNGVVFKLQISVQSSWKG